MKDRANDHSKYKDWIDPEEVQPYSLNAKIHTEKQIRNIANSIRRFGWQQDTVLTSDNVLVIGHGRRLAAIQLGCQMPYHRIDKKADELTDKDIRELRIADNQTNSETGYDFTLLQEDIEDLDFDGFEFDLDFTYNAEDDGETTEKYTNAVNVPQYEPNGIKPDIKELVDLSKVDELISDIESSDLLDSEKQFLKVAAYRHAVIDFDKVADYYAEASAEMQKLMENSALVIIDIQNAIANGYVQLSKSLDRIMSEDDDE